MIVFVTLLVALSVALFLLYGNENGWQFGILNGLSVLVLGVPFLVWFFLKFVWEALDCWRLERGITWETTRARLYRVASWFSNLRA